MSNITFDEIENGASATVIRTLSETDIEVLGLVSGDAGPSHITGENNFKVPSDPGIVLGARVSIVLTSRADTVRSWLASTAVMALVAHARKTGEYQRGNEYGTLFSCS